MHFSWIYRSGGRHPCVCLPLLYSLPEADITFTRRVCVYVCVCLPLNTSKTTLSRHRFERYLLQPLLSRLISLNPPLFPLTSVHRLWRSNANPPNTMEINDISKFAPPRPCMTRVIEFQPPRTMVSRVIFGSTGKFTPYFFFLSLSPFGNFNLTEIIIPRILMGSLLVQ